MTDYKNLKPIIPSPPLDLIDGFAKAAMVQFLIDDPDAAETVIAFKAYDLAYAMIEERRQRIEGRPPRSTRD